MSGTVITRAEFLEINGVPLATPAWEAEDLSGLYDSPAVRGEDVAVPYHEGQTPLRRINDAKRVQIPVHVFGDLDHEGATHADPLVGLQANMDYLKQALRPRQNATVAGTWPIRHILPDESTRVGDGHVIPPFQPVYLGEMFKLIVDLLIPAGVLRAVDPIVVSGSTPLVVPNPGTADQYNLVLELTGSATSVRIFNDTWDTSGNTYLEFLGGFGTGVVIDTGAWTAVRDEVSVVGLLEHAGHERWLPLLAGVDNSLRIEPEGGTATLEVTHYPAYL